jgi:hypothetical protein
LVQHGAANLWFQACASKSSQLRLATQATSRFFLGKPTSPGKGGNGQIHHS